MKINEVIAKSDRTLFEELNRNNDTGFSTEDLMKIARADEGSWSKPMTGEEMIAFNLSLAND